MSASTRCAVVVNDDPIQLSVLAGLVRKAGLEPRAFTGAEAALAAMTAGAPPALIVTDLYMPGLDGWRFCRLLRSPAYAALNEVPILVVSATYSGTEASRIAADLGAEAFLPSPVEGARFCEQVRAILSGEQLRDPLRVLIVDDNGPFCDLLKDVFVNHGYEAETAFTVQAAAVAFEQTAYDVAVLDYHLPDGSGDALLDTFRTQRPDCVCLMMTSDPGPELPLNWMKRGAAAYLHKPFDLNYLIELCTRASRERALLRVQELVEVRTRELRESEGRFRNAMAATRDGLWDWEVQSGLVYFSPAYLGMLGYAPEDKPAALSTWVELIHPEDLTRAQAANQACVRNESPTVDVEFRMRAQDGSWRWIWSRGHAVRREVNGRALQMIGTHTDITERKAVEESLVRVRRNFDTFFHSVDDLLFVLDPQGGILHANRAVYERLGYTPAELLGRPVTMVHPADRIAEVVTVVGEMLAGRTPFCSIPICTKQGRFIPVETRVVAGEWNGQSALFGVTRDVSLLKQSEEKFVRAFHASPLPMAISDRASGRYLEVNEEFLFTLGFNRDEVIGYTSFELGLFPSPEIRAKLLAGLERDGSVRQAEIPVRTKDGTLRRGLFSAEPIQIGDQPCLLTVMLDVTERRRAEVAVQQSEARHSSMVANISDVIGIIGVDGIMKYKSPNIEKWFGWQPQDLVGTDGWLTVHPDDLERIQKEFFSLLEKDRAMKTVEYRYKCKDGSYKPIALTATNLTNDPTINGVLLNYHDITEPKQADELIRASLREKEALLKEVHHRVKNNLQVITSLLRMEARRSEHPTTKSVLQEMKSRILSMALLHESLYRSGTFAVVDLGAYLKQLTNQSFRALAPRPGSIRLHLELASVQVEMDQALPCGLLVNELISNCLKHGFPGDRSGEVRVELQLVDSGPRLRLRVRDTGVGLPTDFESKRGHSLGLQLVSSLARQIGGRLEVGPGPGAVFDVIFIPKHSKSTTSTLPG